MERQNIRTVAGSPTCLPVGKTEAAATSHCETSEFILPNFFSKENLGVLGAISAAQLASSFISPIDEYLNRPRKNFRSMLVDLGAELISGHSSNGKTRDLSVIKDAIECLHSGSLIIDDIQDQSTERRSLPAFHIKNGTGPAICAGNWMYFWPMRLLEQISWTPDQKLQAYEYFSRTMELAHYGQFLDITVKAANCEEQQLAELSIKTAELKTGTITALAFVLGALAIGANRNQLRLIGRFGKTFGLALQRLDDWGNICSERIGTKRFEDLISGKPTTVWHDVVKFCPPADVTAFKSCVTLLPDSDPIELWLASSGVHDQAMKHIEADLIASIGALERSLKLSPESSGILKLSKITEDLLVAYT